MGSSTLKILGLFLFLIVIISVTTFGIFKDITPASKGGLSEEAIQEIIEEYIAQNPEVILKSLTNYQQRSQRQKEEDIDKYIKENKDELENDLTSPMIGNPQGDVTIVEFFDYSCGYCKKVFPTIMELVKEDKNLKVVLKEFPILGENSTLAAKAALAVHEIDAKKYIEFHKALMETRVSGKDNLLKIAADLGIDTNELSEKMDSSKVQSIIDNNKNLASKIGVRGTPAFTINGEFVPGAIDYDMFKQKIKEARADKG